MHADLHGATSVVVKNPSGEDILVKNRGQLSIFRSQEHISIDLVYSPTISGKTLGMG